MALFGNSQPEQPDREAVERQQQRQMQHQANLGMGGGEYTHRETDFIREIIETPAEPPDSVMQNLKSKDFPLANLSEAEKHKLFWDIKYYQEMYKDMHPPPESNNRGERRKALMDDPNEGWDHFHSADRASVEMFISAIEARLTRGKDGFQQKQNNTSINISEAREDPNKDDGSSGWFRS